MNHALRTYQAWFEESSHRVFDAIKNNPLVNLFRRSSIPPFNTFSLEIERSEQKLVTELTLDRDEVQIAESLQECIEQSQDRLSDPVLALISCPKVLQSGQEKLYIRLKIGDTMEQMQPFIYIGRHVELVLPVYFVECGLCA